MIGKLQKTQTITVLPLDTGLFFEMPGEGWQTIHNIENFMLPSLDVQVSSMFCFNLNSSDNRFLICK